jgi:D-alanyl-D-alanine endopeptidase (penicillin-binding protein 7)
LACGLAVLLACSWPLPAVAQTKTPAKKPAAKQTTVKRSTRTSLARAATARRARQAALARQQREAMTPHYKTDDLGNVVPDVRAAAAIVYNPQTGDVLWENNSHDQRSIASLTKIMTAVTFIADDPDLAQKVTVTRADVTRASTTHLMAGEVVSLDDVLHLTLIASDNAAARILARTSDGGTDAFVQRMNEMAMHLGLTNTHYEDPSGLDPRNVSSAYDISHLIAFATSDERLGPIMRTAQFDVETSRRDFTIHSTNKLLGTDVDVVGGKTGFISKAGYCLATLLQVPQGSQVAVVVLGAANSAVRVRLGRRPHAGVVRSRTSGERSTRDAVVVPFAAPHLARFAPVTSPARPAISETGRSWNPPRRFRTTSPQTPPLVRRACTS